MRKATYGTNINEIARLRHKLSIDYELHTRAALKSRQNRTSSLGRVVETYTSNLRRQFLPHYFSSAPKWRVLLRKLSRERVLPDFCVIGPAKSGSSDLAVSLMTHPNILCPLVRECGTADPLEWRTFYPTARTVQRHRRLHGSALSPFVGAYLHHFDIASNLARLRPQAKIIINLRCPWDLVFSEWKWIILHMDQQVVSRIPFLTTFSLYVDQALEVFPSLPIPIHGALHYGIYWSSVAYWLNCFGAQNVRVFDVADYFRDRSSYLQEVAQFLGIPDFAVPPSISVANRNPLEVPPPSPEAISRLKEFFEPYNRRLWSILGTSFPW